MTSPSGRLVLAATPIGDPDDAPPRLVRLLAEADVVAAEDTRRLRRLTSALGVRVGGKVVSHHEHNEASSTPELVALALGGATVALVTDAGMPAVSDPGYRLTRAMVDAGVPVTTVPGPSAALAALAVSGLPTDRFAFEGFLPRKAGPRARALAALVDDPRTLLFFEAPHRTAATLRALAEAFGADRPAALCRELTKTYEEVRRGGLGELADHAEAHEVLGEVTLVVAGAAPGDVDPEDLVAEVLERAAGGERLKDAAKAVAAARGVPVRGLYDAALAARRRRLA
ncbi:16S rRNA (cytidine(1402)-2'-O)-methyltransferase [Angustibacter speluncae]